MLNHKIREGVNMRNVLIQAMLIATAAADSRGPFRRMYPDHGDLTPPVRFVNEDVGNPLFLTPYIEAGNISEAKSLSQVSLGQYTGPSFSGFLTVNKEYNSNLFFWFFPASVGAANAPVLVWLQGGPGGSSLFGLFAEHGPFNVDANLNLVPRDYPWTKTNNVIYIDNPAGTGFSFTDKEEGYARNQTDVGRDLYAALVQFFMLFPELQKNDVYVSGESYAGKYVPAIAYTIHTMNPTAKVKINLKGLAIGDGLCDPITMTDYGDFLYQVGLIDDFGLQHFKNKSSLTVKLIEEQNWLDAAMVDESMLDDFTSMTGLTYVYNYVGNGEPKDMDYWTSYVNEPVVRKAIHVGNMTFNSGAKVAEYLGEDIMKSVKPWIEELLDNYKVMIYNGQLDVIIAYTLTENFLNNLNWSRSQEYKKSSRNIWNVDGEVAGYFREAPGFVQVMIRNAGHMVPYDQPKWAFDMINRFIADNSFPSHQEESNSL